jgi:hypothetical protein
MITPSLKGESVEIEKATLRDLPLLRKMVAAAKAQIERSQTPSNEEVQLDLLLVQLKIAELEQLLH